MPNLKIYMEEARFASSGPKLQALLSDLRGLLAGELSVEPGDCQILVIPAANISGQPDLSAELFVLKKRGRSPATLAKVATAIRSELSRKSGLSVVARVTVIDGGTHVLSR